MKRWTWLIVCGVTAAQAAGQSSSLYVGGEPAPATVRMVGRQPDYLSHAIASTSLSAVKVMPPRQFSLHDLVTIIVRESTQADSEASLDTSKEFKTSASLPQYPGIRVLDEFINLISKTGLRENPSLQLSSKSEFKGDGDYSRKDTFTTRITARIIDIKPNGTMVLEARKFIKSDKESLDMVLTGTCRYEDVTIDNTVLSTQLYDLRLVKEHTGELRKATKKGLLTKVFETIFAF